MTKEKPILFSSSMINAIRERRKTQTRRIVKPQLELCHGCQSCEFQGNHFNFQTKQAYKKGDRLWVRETWKKDDGDNYIYAADSEKAFGPWKSPIFMPREASRISLEVTEVRIEQLQEISEEDALCEGIQSLNIDTDGLNQYIARLEYGGYITSTAKEAFSSLWKDIHSEKNWEENPWCWVVSFSVI